MPKKNWLVAFGVFWMPSGGGKQESVPGETSYIMNYKPSDLSTKCQSGYLLVPHLLTRGDSGMD
jgi:hypothetical protein